MNANRLFILRLAFVAGVIIATAVVVFQRQRLGQTAGDENLLNTIRYGVWGYSLFALMVALMIRGKRESLSIERQNSLTVVGWAPGEGAALLGIVSHFLGGTVATMTVGILAFAVVLVILPIPSLRH